MMQTLRAFVFEATFLSALGSAQPRAAPGFHDRASEVGLKFTHADGRSGKADHGSRGNLGMIGKSPSVFRTRIRTIDQHDLDGGPAPFFKRTQNVVHSNGMLTAGIRTSVARKQEVGGCSVPPLRDREPGKIHERGSSRRRTRNKLLKGLYERVSPQVEPHRRPKTTPLESSRDSSHISVRSPQGTLTVAGITDQKRHTVLGDSRSRDGEPKERNTSESGDRSQRHHHSIQRRQLDASKVNLTTFGL